MWTDIHHPGTIVKNTLPKSTWRTHVPWKICVVYLDSRFIQHGSTFDAVKHRICCAESEWYISTLVCFVVGSLLKGQFANSAVFASLLYGLKYCSFSKWDWRCLDGYYSRLVKGILFLPAWLPFVIPKCRDMHRCGAPFSTPKQRTAPLDGACTPWWRISAPQRIRIIILLHHQIWLEGKRRCSDWKSQEDFWIALA